MFQLTRPCGSRLDVLAIDFEKKSFNSRDPAGRDKPISCLAEGITRFNSRDPAGRDIKIPAERLGLKVSTHATLRVATWCQCRGALVQSVSTHATLRVATSATKEWFMSCEVSTHATLRVATSVSPAKCTNESRFNSRDPAGRDVINMSWIARAVGFNSRDPAGRD